MWLRRSQMTVISAALRPTECKSMACLIFAPGVLQKAQKLIIKSADFCGFHVDVILESPLDSAPSHTDLEFEFCLSNPYLKGDIE